MKKELVTSKSQTNQVEDKKYTSNIWILLIKTHLLALFFVLLMFLVTGIGLCFWGYGKIKKFEQAAGISTWELKNKVVNSWQQEPIQTEDHKNILLLGVDSIAGRGEIPPLTDTMMLISINLKSGTINTLPLPRDLWSEKYQTKINALYFYGLDRYPSTPEKFTQEVIEEMTNIKIHHTIVVSLDELKKLIDLTGGIKVNIPTGFIDQEFARSGVDVTKERDPKILYQTIEFKAGEQTLTGEESLQYIRSRHSEGDEGTDLSRGERQQIIIKALFSQLLNFKQYINNPELAGQLYRWYDDNYAQVFTLEEGIATVKTLLPIRENIVLNSHQLSTTKENPESGVLDNPKPSNKYQKQWVYVINNQDLFQKEINADLFK